MQGHLRKVKIKGKEYVKDIETGKLWPVSKAIPGNLAMGCVPSLLIRDDMKLVTIKKKTCLKDLTTGKLWPFADNRDLSKGLLDQDQWMKEHHIELPQ